MAPEDHERLDALRRALPSMPAVVPGEGGELDEDVEHPEPAPREAAPLQDAFDEAVACLMLQVVDDASGRPLAGVRLALVLPGGEELAAETDASGQVVRGGLQDGAAQVSSDFRGHTRERTYTVLSVEAGEPSTLTALETSGPLALATLSTHQVATGETLASVAEGAGLTLDELTRFLWDTTSPERIQRHLRDDVGCTRGGPDDHAFDDQDRPGTLCLPADWSAADVPLDAWQIIRVAPDRPPCRLTISLLLGGAAQAEDGFPRYVLASQDGSYHEERSAADDLVEGDAYLQLAFEDLDPATLYTLTRWTDDERAEVLFRDEPGERIQDQARAPARGLAEGAFTGLCGLAPMELTTAADAAPDAPTDSPS